MKNLKIAYLGWRGGPCDHRRFSKVASLIGLQAEPYQSGKSYDVIVLTKCSDLTTWTKISRRNPKIIFDFVDSYLKIEPWDLKANLRGLAKYVMGQHRYLEWNYNDSVRHMIERADGVICSTPEQKEEYLALNSNVHDILDFNGDQIRHVKTDYHMGDTLHLAWEGMGANAWTFQEIAPVLKKLHARRPLALHLVTDVKYASHAGPMALHRELKPILRRLLGDVPVYLYEWNSAMLSAICTRCDIGLLPIPKKPAVYWAKPENRLLMLWQMGLPVLASSTPAYARCMQAADNNEACENLDEWEEKLAVLIESEDLRRQSAERGRRYATEQVNEIVLCQKWAKALESVL